jgi:hypothetical protein
MFMGARQLVRQDGWHAAIFGGRNRPSLLILAHQLASAYNNSNSTMAQQIAQAVIAFEQRRTGNHVLKLVTVVLSEGTLC